MSPAMVDFRTPATASPSIESNRSPSQSPRKGQIFTSSSPFLFDQSYISASDHAPNTELESMDRTSLGHGIRGSRSSNDGSFDSSFVSPSPSPTVLASRKPSTTGLLKPRLVKVRRHLGTPRVKPPVVSERGIGLGFNPFRSGPSVADATDQTEDHGTQVLREQLYSWNPLNSEGGRVSESSGCPNLGNSESVKSEGAGFVFGASSVLNSNSKNSFVTEGSGNRDKGVFVFGSGVKESSNLGQNSSFGSDEGSFSKLPDEMRKLNLQRSGNGIGSSDTAGFVFGASSVSYSDSKTSGYGNAIGGAFVFGSGVKRSSNYSQNSSLGSDEGSFSGFEETKQADHGSKVDENNFSVFGSSKNVPGSFGVNTVNKLPEEMGKLNIGSSTAPQNIKDKSEDFSAGVFVFGSNMKKSSVSSKTSATSFMHSDKAAVSEVPDEIQKSNIGGFRSDDGFKKTTEPDCNSKVCESDGFVFGSISGGSAVNTLHDDMKKMNICSKTEFSAGCTDQVFLSDGVTTGASTPLTFAFQAGKQDSSSSIGPIPPSQTHHHFTPGGVATPTPHISAHGPGFQTAGTEFTLRSTLEDLEPEQMNFRTAKQDASWSSKKNLFSGLDQIDQSMTFTVKKGVVKDSRTKKRRGKLRQSAPFHQSHTNQFISKERSSQECPEPESPGSYSPMDFSPYQENIVADQCPREASVASDESIALASRCASTDTQKSISVDEREEDLVSATQRMDIKEERELDENGTKDHVERHVTTESSTVDEQVFGPGKENLTSGSENVDANSDSSTAAARAETGPFSSNIEMRAGESGSQFNFASCSDDFGESNFTFSTSTSAQGPLSSSKRHYRRKNLKKTGQDPYNSTPNAKVPLSSSSEPLFSVASTFLHPDPAQSLKGVPFIPQREEDNGAKADRKREVRKEPISTTAASNAAQEACEKWRLRGNQAYANGHLSKAEEYYTLGVNSVPPNETSRSCVRALMLCYSNRSATRLSLGRVREALSDSTMATAIDPNFFRAQVRAANCHLALGESADALKHFKKCLQSGIDVSLDKKILIEASDGLKKAQQLAGYMERSAELLRKKTSNDVTHALQILSEALSISPYSETLTEMKAEALLMLRHYEEVVQLCEQTLDSAERNSVLTGADDQFKNVGGSESMESSPVRLWRWRIISKSYFYLGKLEEALELLQKHEQVKPIVDKSSESSTSFSVTVRELIRLKSAGNEAFQAGRYLDAVEHYSAALACNTESRPFAAICFCNRAAAYQALGQITDAIADCSLAIALDASYPKAISRRATLYEMIRDYGQATNDLHRLISLLEKRSGDKDNQSGGLGRSTSDSSDLKRACLRVSKVEEEARKGIPLDMYLILGTEPSSTAADVKKAYRKAALRHHPDKAGQFLIRSENVDDGLWREMTDEVHRDADRLFKMIGEAYTILSDPTKRLQYDAEEEMRTTLKKGNSGCSTPKTPADVYTSQYEKSGSNRQWRETWKRYGSSHQQWSESSRSNTYF